MELLRSIWRNAFTPGAGLALALVGLAYGAGGHAVADEPDDEEVVEICGTHCPGRVAVVGTPAVAEVVRRQLELGGGVLVIDPESIPAELGAASDFDRRAWSEIGAHWVVRVDDRGGAIRLRFHDLARGEEPVLSKTYRDTRPREAAQRFTNDMIGWLTGVPGVWGSPIAFVRRRASMPAHELVLVDADGVDERRVAASRFAIASPSIGPTGDVLFTSWAKRGPDLWAARGDRSRRISTQPGLDLGGVTSPDGRSIAVTLTRDGNSELYLLDATGGIRRRLTDHAAIDGSPTWSGDGEQLAFVSDRDGKPRIFAMGADGSGTRSITKGGDYDQSPDWSHGTGKLGRTIAFSRGVGDRVDIFTVRIDTGRTTALTQGTGRHTDPTWSPDGRLLAVASSRKGIVMMTDWGMVTGVIARDGVTPDWGPVPARLRGH